MPLSALPRPQVQRGVRCRGDDGRGGQGEAVTFALIGLVAISVSLTGFTITCGVWLHSANADRLNAADLIDGQRKLVAEYKHKFDTELVAHTVTAKQLEQERQLRGVAEARLKEAQTRLSAYLAQNLRGATEDEINAVLVDLFASPLGLVPAPVPRRSDHPTDGLLPID